MSFSFTKVDRAAIIVAAGSGTRMGPLSLEHGVPKVLFPLGGSTAVAMSVKAFIDAGVSQVVVVINEDYRADYSEALKLFESHLLIVAGGGTRSESVRAGLSALCLLSSSALIAVHDAARCFCTTKLINECFESAAEHGAATAAVPAIDTVVISSAAPAGSPAIEAFLPRERVWQVQTPQIFRAELLRKAHQWASTDSQRVFTDDASLVREFHGVKLVIGERNNFKLTTPGDYQMALTLTGASAV